MTVQCPRCQTQYRVPEDRLVGAQPVFKCTRCEHVFKTQSATPTRAKGRKRNADDNLSFNFEKDGIAGTKDRPIAGEATSEGGEPAFVSSLEAARRAPAGTDDSPTGPAPGDRESRGLRTERSPAAGGESSDAHASGEDALEDPSIETDRSEDSRFEDDLIEENDEDLAREEDSHEEEDDEVAVEEDPEEDPEPLIVASPARPRSIRPRATKPPPRRSPLRPISIGIGLVVACYLVVAATLNRNPSRTMDQFSELPVLGRFIGSDNLLAWRLEVSDLEGGLDYIRDHRLAYVVSGKAINTTSEDLRIIEVEGQLIADGAASRNQKVYAANQARSTIRDLSASEVEMLLRLEPNRRFRIRPGESASFLLVFPDPPPGFREVVVKIVDAQGT